MESEKHYFLEGVFIIVLMVGAAFAFIWLGKTGNRDDVTYRIHFAESVSGLALGDAVKYQGVDVGTVKTMTIDNADPRLVQVDVRLRKDTPVKTDTKASLKLKGITGTLFVELTAGTAEAKNLRDVTPEGQIPEIPFEKSKLASLLDALPNMVEKFSAMEGKASKVLGDVGKVTGTMKEAAENAKEATAKVKENPSVLLWGSKKKEPTKAEERK